MGDVRWQLERAREALRSRRERCARGRLADLPRLRRPREEPGAPDVRSPSETSLVALAIVGRGSRVVLAHLALRKSCCRKGMAWPIRPWAAPGARGTINASRRTRVTSWAVLASGTGRRSRHVR
eukprot:5008297-Alexandrium_andersonii.AAC.1